MQIAKYWPPSAAIKRWGKFLFILVHFKHGKLPGWLTDSQLKGHQRQRMIWTRLFSVEMLSRRITLVDTLCFLERLKIRLLRLNNWPLHSREVGNQNGLVFIKTTMQHAALSSRPYKCTKQRSIKYLQSNTHKSQQVIKIILCAGHVKKVSYLTHLE